MIGAFFAVRAQVAAHASANARSAQNQPRAIVPLRMNRSSSTAPSMHASGAWKTLMPYVWSFPPVRTVICPHLRGLNACGPAAARRRDGERRSERDHEDQHAHCRNLPRHAA